MKTNFITVRWAIPLVCAALAMFVAATPASAADKHYWLSNPASGNWKTAGNWFNGSPNGALAWAVFDDSTVTSISLSPGPTEVNGIEYITTLGAYDITVPSYSMLTMSGTGIANNSLSTQNFVTDASYFYDGGRIVFANGATAGSNTVITNNGSSGVYRGGSTWFTDNSTAGRATLIAMTGGDGTSATGGGDHIFRQFERGHGRRKSL